MGLIEKRFHSVSLQEKVIDKRFAGLCCEIVCVLRLKSFSNQQVGKSEQTSQRFRRKERSQDKSLSSSEHLTNPLVSPSSHAHDLLLDSVSPDFISSREQTHGHSPDLSAANGTCHAEAELPDRDVNGLKSPLSRDDSVPAADFTPREDPDGRKDLCLTSYLPAELSGLPHSEITLVCTNKSLDLSAYHVQKDDSTEFVVFIKTSSGSAAHHVQVHVNCEELEVIHVQNMVRIYHNN